MKLHSLFVKIFFWFWITMLFVIFTLGLAMWVSRGDVYTTRQMGKFRERTRGIGIIDIYEENGIEAAKLAARSFPFKAGLLTLVFDNTSKEIFGQSAEKNVVKAVESALTTGKVAAGNTEVGEFRARVVLGESGNKFVLVNFSKGGSNIQIPLKFLAHGSISSRLLSILLLLTTTFILCYVLARYITNPIVRLQRATREFAKGNLGHRIQEEVAGRQDELVDLAVDFDVMAERVQELLGTQRRLLGDISHELRTPLTRLNVALELVRDSSGDEAEKHLDRIARESDRLQELINCIVTFVRLEGTTDHFACGHIDMQELVSSIAVDAQIEAKVRDCTISQTCGDSCTVFGSRELLRRAIENVVRNGLRHTKDSTIVDINCMAKEDIVVIVITDHGFGVDDEHLELLFQPFYRCEAARERSRGGVGLGLAIVKRAVEFHGGTVSAENSDAGGLSVTMKIPVQAQKFIK